MAGQIAIAVRNAFSYERIEELNAQLAREKLYLEDEISSQHDFKQIVGTSHALTSVLRQIHEEADVTPLLGRGERPVAQLLGTQRVQLCESRHGVHSMVTGSKTHQ